MCGYSFLGLDAWMGGEGGERERRKAWADREIGGNKGRDRGREKVSDSKY